MGSKEPILNMKGSEEPIEPMLKAVLYTPAAQGRQGFFLQGCHQYLPLLFHDYSVCTSAMQ